MSRCKANPSWTDDIPQPRFDGAKEVPSRTSNRTEALQAAPVASGSSMIAQMSNEEIERDRSNENPMVGKPAPAPAELEPVAWLVVINGKFNSLHWTEGEAAKCIEHFNNGSKLPLVRLTDTQAAIAAKDEEIERLRGAGKLALKSSGRSLKRAEAAEARVADLEKTLEAIKFHLLRGSYAQNSLMIESIDAALHPKREG